MKRIRLIPTLLLCLALIATSTTALAASKAATTKPTVKISVPKGTMRGGVGGDLTVTPSVPGFLTLKLLSEDGYELMTLCEGLEVHTKANTIEFTAADEDGEPLAEGSYTVSAVLVNQYGNESKEATASIKMGAGKPTLTIDAVASTKKFKLTADCSVTFSDKKGAEIELSLYRTKPQAMYFEDFETVEVKEPGSATTQEPIVLTDGNELPSPAGYYTIKGVVSENSSGIVSDEVEVALVVDTDGAAYLLEDAPDDVLASVDAAIAKMIGEEETETKSTSKSVSSDEDEEEEEKAKDADASSEDEESEEDDEPKKAADETTYESGNSVMGDDGLEVGVGVSDVAVQTNAGYWGLTSSSTDEDIWAAITRTMISADVAENESAYIYDSPEEGRKRLGTVSGLSQGLNVIKEREDGWSLVEAFRNEDGAFIRGYIRTNKLRIVEPNTTYGIVIDKADQTLTVWKDGEPIGSCDVSTGLATSQYLHRETPAGEYILVTRRGTIEYYGNGFSKYTIRFSGNYHLCEIPTTKKNGSDFTLLEDSLGEKATRGHICVAHDASSDGGINAEWIWEMTDTNKKVKVLILDDKARTEVPVGE